MLNFGIIGTLGSSLAVLPILLLPQVVAIGNENPGFIGYTETASGTFTAEDCGPSWTRFSTVLASTTYGSCANGTDKNPLMPIACEENTVYRADGTSSASYYTCGTGKQCVTRHIFPSAGATNYAVDMNCGTTSSETVYMTVPGGSVLIDENGNLIIIAGGVSTSPTPGVSGPETSFSPDSSRRGTSPEAIAGAVIGSVVGAGIVLAAIVMGLRIREKKKKKSQASFEKDDESNQTSELETKVWHEMPGNEAVAEKPVESERFERDVQRHMMR